MENIRKETFFSAINKSLQNASELITEAKLLKSNNHISRAYTLFQLAIEEIGKAIMIFHFLLFEDFENEDSKKKLIKTINQHKIKTKSAIDAEYIILQLHNDEKLKEKLKRLILYQEKSIDLSNDSKNNSLYVTFIKGEVYSPFEMIKFEMLKRIEIIAELKLFIIKEYIENDMGKFDQLVEYINEKKL